MSNELFPGLFERIFHKRLYKYIKYTKHFNEGVLILPIISSLGYGRTRILFCRHVDSVAEAVVNSN